MVTHQDCFEIMYHTEIAEAIEKGSRIKDKGNMLRVAGYEFTGCELKTQGSRTKVQGNIL
jgi:hypothetical protein